MSLSLRNQSAACAALLGLIVTPALMAQAAPAGVTGSHFEPWQEGGTPDGAKSVASLAAAIEAMPKNLPRAKAPPLVSSMTAAKAAVDACTVKGAKVSVLVTDAAGEPVVLLSGDGAGVRSQLIARTKTNIVVRYRMASGDVAEKAKTDPSLNAQAAADPAIGMIRAGGFPVMKGSEIIGAVAASGGSLGGDMTLDEKCAKVALDSLQATIR